MSPAGQFSVSLDTHSVAHRHDRRHAALQQGVSGPGEARLFLKVEVFADRVLRARLLALGDGDVFHGLRTVTRLVATLEKRAYAVIARREELEQQMQRVKRHRKLTRWRH